MLVSGTYPNLINGVSQQTPALRLNSQCEELVNGYCSIVDGLSKRPPTNHVAKLSSATTWTNAKVHTINRDANEKYAVVITSGSISAYDLSGNQKTVTFSGSSASYLSITKPANESLRAFTIADTTFIVNREKTIQMATDTSPVQKPTALVWVKSGVTGTDYKVEVTYNGTTYTALKSTATSGTIKTTDISAFFGLNASYTPALPVEFVLTPTESIVGFTRSDGNDFSIKVYDSYGNTAVSVIKGKVQRFSDLPAVALPGLKVHIMGDPTNNEDDYWAEFQTTTGSTAGKGLWVESIAPGIKYKFDKSTMPHILQRQADGTFLFKEAPWEDRTSGDELSAVEPTFVGSNISDVFLFKNRLGFLCEENVIMSQSGKFYNFWPTTVTTILDDAPIDVQGGSNEVTVFNHAVPFHDKLLLFSDSSQFTLVGGDLLSPKTVSITMNTHFDTLKHAKPVNAGNSVFFPFPRGDYSGIREYFVQDNVEVNDAADVTAHVPRYVRGVIKQLTVSTTDECLVCLSDTPDSSLYVYQWKWSDNSKVQSAWHRWTFDGKPIGIDFMADVLYILLQRDDGVYLERVDLLLQVDSGSSYLTSLDRRVKVSTGTYDPNTNTSWYVVPYLAATYQAYSVSSTGIAEGISMVVTGSRLNGSNREVGIQGNHASPMWIGVGYTMSYTMSQPFIREDVSSGGRVAVQEGRLQISKMSLRYSRSSYFKVNVKPDRVSSYTYTFTGKVCGSSEYLLGTIGTGNGVFEFPVRTRNEQMIVTITNDSPFPCYLVGAEWHGQYTPKSRRV